MTRIRAIVRGLLGVRNESGAAAIEFALLTPVLALIVVGMLDLGFLMYQVMQLNSAVEAGALYVLANGWNNLTGATPIIKAMQQTGSVTGTPTAMCFYGCPNGTAGVASQSGTCGSGSSTQTCTNGYAPGQYVKINAQLSTTTLVDTGIFSFFQGGLTLPNPLTATATIRVP